MYSRKDHPRSRGVYPGVLGLPGLGAGSSPLARGLLMGLILARARCRIIPARAGFTLHHHEIISASRDHPRSRGVYAPFSLYCASLPGSSPLARGLPNMGQQQHVRNRIIPARAGFTALCPAYSGQGGDHPRSRGVYPAGVLAVAEVAGSSPLARGLPDVPSLLPTSGRIIPARAGFTGAGSNRATASADHPRSRGVYSPPAQEREDESGSSPLARGLPLTRHVSHHTQRIIPARAGFTHRAW